jgi:hypothetical protein
MPFPDTIPTRSFVHTIVLQDIASAWEVSARVNAELLQLMPALFSRTSPAIYTVSFRGGNTTATPIRSLRKHVHAPGHEWDGRDILLAVNIDRARNSANFGIPGLADSGSVRVLFEQRDVVVANESFIDVFEAMDTHVYLLPLSVNGHI